MADKTLIEWAANADGTPGATWNPVRARARDTGKAGWFCVHESEGCRNCYAERLNARLGTGVAFKAQNRDQVEVYLDAKTLRQPLAWSKPKTIFVGSMTDLFGEFAPDDFIDQVFAIAALSPWHTFIVLTKRSRRMALYVRNARARVARCVEELGAEGVRRRRGFERAVGAVADPVGRALISGADWPLPNVWLGVSAEDQEAVALRAPDLLDTPAAVRFLSCEPLLGPIELVTGGIDWIIAGGESGPDARPMHPNWPRHLRDQCAAAGVPFFFKQWGEWLHHERVGKARAGRLLDGREHNERPLLAHQGEPPRAG